MDDWMRLLRDSPKSTSVARRSSESSLTMMLLGLTSPWRMPWLCVCPRPIINQPPRRTVSRRVSGWRPRRSARVMPGTQGSARYNVSSS
jgi:hypothetical protein